jgi:hypothetical protein
LGTRGLWMATSVTHFARQRPISENNNITGAILFDFRQTKKTGALLARAPRSLGE